jgi:hypothetical protein
MIPQGGYTPNGNILLHYDSVMGAWNFSFDAMDRAGGPCLTISKMLGAPGLDYETWEARTQSGVFRSSVHVFGE